MSYFENSKLLWKPQQPFQTSIARLRRFINRKHGLSLENYDQLHQYSIETYTFWVDLWEFLGIISSVPPGDKIIEPGTIPEVPVWFPGTRLNWAENHLRRVDDAIACTTGGETGVVKDYSYRQLRELVRQMASAMRAHGLKAGDRVAAVVNNTINAIVICFATASIGAIYSSTSSDMGAPAILDRFTQLKPKLIVSETEVVYGGNVVNISAKTKEVFQTLRKHGTQLAIALPSVATGKDIKISNSVSLSKFLSRDDGRPLVFEQLPFSHPLFILFTSGTSGPPKCIVHSAGGFLLQSLKEKRLHWSVDPEDTFFQWTTTGWTVWNGMLSNFANGSRLVLYDGSPFYPSTREFLKFVNDQGVSVFGTGPRFIAEVIAQGINPREIGSFEALKTISCVGSVMTSPMFAWTQKAFGDHILIVSPYGGTETCIGLTTGNNSLPVYAGEIQCKGLGMDVRVFDPQGNNIEDTGVAGEIVVVRPHPTQPLYLWGDKDGKKYRETYFSMYPGAWQQGDFVVMNPVTKGIKILGRSDGVLNPSGVRFGATEIYSVLERFLGPVTDFLCVGQRRPEDVAERVLLFLKMRPGTKLEDSLVAEIKTTIRNALSPRHVPAFVLEVADIPYTVNGKRIEQAVKQIVSKSGMKPSGTVANPDSLKLYYKFQDLPVAELKSRM
ncbi:AMP-binding domain-containing protein [Favolaschia claudopus]|uniref:AMP-binding domain-containing protein n=1 Tax=Favolaschia claudopus TaxID=2862362 RepID=A0AAW0DWI6_9AGAR